MIDLTPLRVHGPLDTPAVQHNREVELNAVSVLQDPLAGVSLRFDAQIALEQLGWSELQIRVAKGERITRNPAAASGPGHRREQPGQQTAPGQDR